jgi:hypothetical protein
VILIKLAGRNTGAEQSVALEIERLAAVRLAHAHVADQHQVSVLTPIVSSSRSATITDAPALAKALP